VSAGAESATIKTEVAVRIIGVTRVGQWAVVSHAVEFRMQKLWNLTQNSAFRILALSSLTEATLWFSWVFCLYNMRSSQMKTSISFRVATAMALLAVARGAGAQDRARPTPQQQFEAASSTVRIVLTRSVPAGKRSIVWRNPAAEHAEMILLNADVATAEDFVIALNALGVLRARDGATPIKEVRVSPTGTIDTSAAAQRHLHNMRPYFTQLLYAQERNLPGVGKARWVDLALSEPSPIRK
jgi:hypothetical protein